MQGRFKGFFNRDRKTLYVILSIVLISIFSLTIVYAALSVTLNIQGSAEVVASTWNIHLDNIKVTSGSVSGTTPSITSPTTASFSTTLNIPGDFYEFSIDVVNDGTIDAMIDSVIKEPTLTTNQAKYLNYIIEYQNGESINTKQLVSKNSFVRLKVRVEFRKDITASDLPTTSETLNLAFTVNYVQSDGSASSVKGDGKYVYADGDINNIGTIVTIGTEQFYTIGAEGDNIKLLSKMNITLENNPIQSPNQNFPRFSGINSTYAGSEVEEYVNNYKTLLESNYGIDISEARLITYDELTDSETFGCIEFDYCSNKYPWIYSTKYWTGSAYDTSNVWFVSASGKLQNLGIRHNSVCGVRPVIVIPKNQINNSSTVEKKLIEFTINMVETYQAEEGMTWAEWVNSEYNIDEYYILNNYVTSNGLDIIAYNGDNLKPIDIIVSNAKYTCSATNPT